MTTSQQRPQRSESSRGEKQSRPTANQVAAKAIEQLSALAAREVESVTGLERTDDGWTVRLEVVEARRVPDSADILAMYEVQVDTSAEMTGYRRLRRYSRGHTGDDD